MERDTQNKLVKIAITSVYLICVAMVSATLIIEHDTMKWLYSMFPVLLVVAYWSSDKRIKLSCAWLSLILLFGGSVVEPLPLDAVEESFIVLPLCYIMLFPGSLWPIAVGIVLIASYMIDLPESEFGEFIEDAIEVIFITLFATVMTHFQQKSARQAQLYLKASLTDSLTQLPNRDCFMEDLESLDIDDSKDYAAIQVGLRQLKKVNDDLGYGYGDELLRQFADLIKEAVARQGRVYRLGGDELVILVEFSRLKSRKVDDVVDALNKANATICQVHSTSFNLQFSGGIGLLSQAQSNVTVWGKNVDAAIAESKRHSEDYIQWYDDELMDRTIRDHQIEAELKSAIAGEQLFLLYQPKVDLTTNRIVGAEALIRWHHKDLGFVPPVDFIGIAEKTAQIIPIGRWVIYQAAMQAKYWVDEGYDLSISVNVSSIQFAHDDLYSYITEVLASLSLPAKHLQIEITETTLIENYAKVTETCQKLRALGVTIAIDDFGVAYSSLNYLKQLPIDVLKIDKSFIDDCVESDVDHMLVRTIIQMGHNLNMTVVAEGVETETQKKLLQDEQCHQFQGYYFSKPISPELFCERMAKN